MGGALHKDISHLTGMSKTERIVGFAGAMLLERASLRAWSAGNLPDKRNSLARHHLNQSTM